MRRLLVRSMYNVFHGRCTVGDHINQSQDKTRTKCILEKIEKDISKALARGRGKGGRIGMETKQLEIGGKSEHVIQSLGMNSLSSRYSQA